MLSAFLPSCHQLPRATLPILLQRDQARQADPTWLLSENMIGMTLYVDLFAGTFEGVREKIPTCKNSASPTCI
jgi:hypothetical protein